MSRDRPDGTLDRAFDVLSNRYRRRILLALGARAPGRGGIGPVPVSDLVRSGADAEGASGAPVDPETGVPPGKKGRTRPLVTRGRGPDPPVVASGDRDPDAVATELYHVHLPKLVEAGYVEWGDARETIRRGPDFPDVEPLVHLLYEHWDELPGRRP